LFSVALGRTTMPCWTPVTCAAPSLSRLNLLSLEPSKRCRWKCGSQEERVALQLARWLLQTHARMVGCRGRATADHSLISPATVRRRHGAPTKPPAHHGPCAYTSARQSRQAHGDDALQRQAGTDGAHATATGSASSGVMNSSASSVLYRMSSTCCRKGTFSPSWFWQSTSTSRSLE